MQEQNFSLYIFNIYLGQRRKKALKPLVLWDLGVPDLQKMSQVRGHLSQFTCDLSQLILVCPKNNAIFRGNTLISVTWIAK